MPINSGHHRRILEGFKGMIRRCTTYFAHFYVYLLTKRRTDRHAAKKAPKNAAFSGLARARRSGGAG